ncbi:GNAT family N-acetyltransferase, partial [Legionella pneumophila serogroup 1]
SICTFRDGIEDNSKGEISAIYIHPNFWHQGFGKKLSLAALKTLKELGYTEALLWVLSDNHQARSFYEGTRTYRVRSCFLPLSIKDDKLGITA